MGTLQTRADLWVTRYSIIAIVAALAGVVAAHLPGIFGTPWSTCRVSGSVTGCVIGFHLFEVPIIAYFLWVAWYGLRRYRWERRTVYASFLIVAAAVILAFLAFETQLLIDSLRRSAPEWESIVLASLVTVFVGGVALGLYVIWLLISPDETNEGDA